MSTRHHRKHVLIVRINSLSKQQWVPQKKFTAAVTQDPDRTITLLQVVGIDGCSIPFMFMRFTWKSMRSPTFFNGAGDFGFVWKNSPQIKGHFFDLKGKKKATNTSAYQSNKIRQDQTNKNTKTTNQLNNPPKTKTNNKIPVLLIRTKNQQLNKKTNTQGIKESGELSSSFSSAFPAISLVFTIWGEIFAFVTAL